MKSKNGRIFGMMVLIGFILAACNNPIMEKWWPEPGTKSNPIVVPDPNKPGGGGENFGVVHFDLDFHPNLLLDEGPQPKDLHIAYNSIIGRLRPIIRTGYGFTGWSDEKGDPWDVETREVKPEDDVDGDGIITLKAGWSKNTHTVDFVTSPSASVIAAQTVASGGKITQPVNPELAGFGFAGWYDNPGFTGQPWNFANSPVSGNMTLYAKWDAQYRTVIFDSNGGTRPDGITLLTHTQTISISYGYIQDPGPLVKEGCSFAGWYEDPGFAGDPWIFSGDQANKVTEPGANFFLYAKWVPNIYIIKFETNPSEETIDDQPVAHGHLIIQPSELQQLKDGRGFAGWYTVDGDTHTDGWNLKYLWNFTYGTVSGNMTLYARWAVQAPVIPPDPDPEEPGGSGENFGLVVFDTDGGTPKPLPLKIVWENTVGRLRPISKPGYGFIGWFDESDREWDVETRPVKKEDDVNNDGFITLTIKWSDPSYTVDFITYPGSVPQPSEPTVIPSQKIASGGKVVQPVMPTPPYGYGFAGWFTEPGYIHRWNFSLPPSTDVTLYAQWEQNTRLVHFDSDGGKRPDGETLLTHTQTVPVGYVIQDPGPLVKSTFSFGGWYTDNTSFTNQWDFAVNTLPGPAGTDFWLYAKWVPNTYIIKFVTTPTSIIIEDQKILHGGKITEPVPEPAAAGFLFEGWYTDKDFKSETWDFANGIVTDTMTLYAKWVKIYTVKFEPYPSSSVLVLPNNPVKISPIEQIRHGDKISQPNVYLATGDGRGFAGWFKEESYLNQWDFANNGVISDMTLYAKYVYQTRTVVFNENGGQDMFRTHFTVPINGMIINPGTPVRTGFTFKGWFFDPACTLGNAIDFARYRVETPDLIVGLDPLYLYAGWNVSTYNVSFSTEDLDNVAESQTVPYGERAAKPEIKPEIMAGAEPGYILQGWYTDKTCIESSVWDFDLNTVTSNRVLYAKWEKADYIVRYHFGDPHGTGLNAVYSNALPEEQHYSFDDTVNEPFMPPLPPRPLDVNETDYSFSRWDFSFADPVNSAYQPEGIDNEDFRDTLEEWNFNWKISDHLDKFDGYVLNLYARWVPPLPEMVWVPRGKFILGDSGVNGSPASYHSHPTRSVTLDGFYMSRYEVTQIKYDQLMNGKINNSSPSNASKDNRKPVERVSWYDAVYYCKTLTDDRMGPENLTHVYSISGEFRAGDGSTPVPTTTIAGSISSANVTATWTANGYRLPTEAEWEYAAKGAAGMGPYTIYSGSDTAEDVAWYNETVKTQPVKSTQQYGLKDCNELGIYDMSGNVSEWCWDYFVPYKDIVSGSVSDSNNPNENPRGPISGTERVRRGGAWNNAAGNVRSVVRNSEPPANANWVVGFRVVRGPSVIW